MPQTLRSLRYELENRLEISRRRRTGVNLSRAAVQKIIEVIRRAERSEPISTHSETGRPK